jgi:hypothetical protein
MRGMMNAESRASWEIPVRYVSEVLGVAPGGGL